MKKYTILVLVQHKRYAITADNPMDAEHQALKRFEQETKNTDSEVFTIVEDEQDIAN